VTSDKQTQANRQNALKSTGPKTLEGKAAVRHNALKHGLLAQDVLLPNKDEATFEELDERLREELRPWGSSRACSGRSHRRRPLGATPPRPGGGRDIRLGQAQG
jgi:hypothetical protein